MELIKITEKEGRQVVSARDLHLFLAVKTEFAKWMDRMLAYGFQENADYSLVKIGERSAHNKVDYALTLDTAKEISMLQRSKKGKEARQYFIEAEKQLKAPKNDDQKLLDAFTILNKRIENTQAQLKQANDTIIKQAPSVVFVQEVLKSDSCHTITIIAKELGMSAMALNKKLNELGVQYKQRDTWVLYHQYQDKGYTKTQTSTYIDHTGKEQTTIHTVWTERGRAFIHHKINPALQKVS